MKSSALFISGKRFLACSLAAVVAVGIVPAKASAAEVLEPDAEDTAIYQEYEKADEEVYQEMLAASGGIDETTISDVACDVVWPDTINWDFSGGTLTISGTGAMPRYIGYGLEPWKAHTNDVTKVVIGEGITGIGAYAFYNRPNLKEVKLPSTLERLGPFAFGACPALKEIDIPAGEVGEAVFINDTGLEKVTVGKKVKSFGVSAFESCNAIKGVYISDLRAWCGIDFYGLFSNPVEMGEHILYLNGQQITELTIPDGLTEVKPLAFMEAKGITTLNVPAGVTTIGHWAFAGMRDLTTVNLPDGLRTIDVAAFNSDTSIGTINFPASIDYIGSYAFSCSPLGTVSVSQGYIGKCAFEGCGIGTLNLGDSIKYIGEDAFAGTPVVNGGMAIPYTGKPYRSRQTVEFGTYKNEKLKWLCLGFEDGKALLVTEKVVSFEKYCNNNELGHSIGNDLAADWSRSTIRTWLNDTFYNTAFTDADKAKIQQTALADTGTEDKIFLLSSDEAAQYFANNDDRQVKPSDYLMENRVGRNAEGNYNYGALYSATTKSCYWWLRSLGDETFNAQYVCYTGAIRPDGCGEANGDLLGIRPAIYVNPADFGLSNREESVKSFILRAYQLILGRNPDQAGFRDWAQKLLDKTDNGASLASGFIFSKEFINKNVSDEEYVSILYKTFFDTEGDAAGRAYWINKLKQGYSRKYVLAGFLNSDQYTGICKQFDIVRGDYRLTDEDRERKEENLYVDVEKVRAYVASLYMNILGRDPDPAGMDYWVEQIVTRKKTAANVAMVGFFESKEYVEKNKSPEDFVEDCYKSMMGRGSDAAGKQYWVEKLGNGEYTRPKVIEVGFGNSKEFGEILQGYGLKMLPADDQ